MLPYITQTLYLIYFVNILLSFVQCYFAH